MIEVQKQLRAYTIQERHRVIVRSRLLYGFSRLFSHPWTLVFPFLLAAFAAFMWGNRSKLPLPGGSNSLPEVTMLWQFTLSALIVVLSLLALWGILALLGTPRHAKQINATLVHVGLVDHYNLGPVLLTSRHVKGSFVQVLEFWAKGISLEEWENKRKAIEDALNIHMVEPPTYGGRKGNNRHRIVLTITPGVESRQKATLYDDEL